MDLPPAFIRSSTIQQLEEAPVEEHRESFQADGKYEERVTEGFFSSILNESMYFIEEFVDPSSALSSNYFNTLEPLDPDPLDPDPFVDPSFAELQDADLQVVIVCVVDRSGSMQESLPKLMRTLQEVMQDQQAVHPTAEVYLTDFNSKVFQHPVKPISSVVKDGFPLLTAEGTTAYYDAAHTTILNILQKYSNEVKKVFITLTDGEDNSSSVKERSVYDLIKFAEQRNSSFIYLGSSKELLLNGDNLGIKAQIEFDQLNINIPQLRRGITEEVSRGISLSQNTAD
jgi:hypothetical protein